MKIYCARCEAFLGEITKGAVRKGAVVVCQPCYERFKIADTMAKLAREQAAQTVRDVSDFMKGLFT